MAADSQSLLPELGRHLSALEQDPGLKFDVKLFEECQLFLAHQLAQDPERLLAVLPRITGVLLAAQQDPAPVVGLVSRLVEPLSFAQITSLQPPIDFVAGLSPDALPFNLLVLDLLDKAAESAKDAAVLAGMPKVVAALVTLWLSTSDLGVADRSLAVLLRLLDVDREGSGVPVHGVGGSPLSARSSGQGLVWRRLFGDRDVYDLLFCLTSLSDAGSSALTKREKSLAQARLLSLLPPLGAQDWSYISRSHHPEIERRYGLEADQGLLHYASIRMIDYKDDVLLHMNLLQFFADLISTVTVSSPTTQHSSLSLDFLHEFKLHDRTMAFWLDSDNPAHDPVDVTFLYGPSAHYIAVYASQYPDALLASQTLPQILVRLSKALAISANQWAHGDSPKHNLSVLSALPRSSLLPQATLGTGRGSSPLLQVPSKLTNEDALHTLSKVLGGPRAGEGLAASRIQQEEQTAPLLFHAYHHYHPTLFADLVVHADTVALPGKALAALTLLSSIVSAKWSSGSPLTQTALASIGDASNLATSSIPVLLRQPARDAFLPYILRAPRTFSNLIGGGGDPESAAYKIAMAKWDCLMLFQRRLSAWQPEPGVTAEELGLQAVRDAVTVRVAEGVWGNGGQEVGGRIATLEL